MVDRLPKNRSSCCGQEFFRHEVLVRKPDLAFLHRRIAMVGLDRREAVVASRGPQSSRGLR
jgi:hypothetical protein